MFCSKCGQEINDEAVVCIHCGCAVNKEAYSKTISDDRDWMVVMLLSWFLGGFGVHRFYTGHIGTGIAQLLTAGGCGIWAFVDWVCICFNNFKDAENKSLKNYKRNVGITVFALGIILPILYFIGCVFVGILSAI